MADNLDKKKPTVLDRVHIAAKSVLSGTRFWSFLKKSVHNRRINRILAYYKRRPDLAKECGAALKFLKQEKKITPYTFPLSKAYSDTPLLFDEEKQLPFALHKGKKLYFPAGTEPYVYTDLLIEQDANSPHLYITPELERETFGAIVDIGAAEAFFALEYADKVDKIVIVEAEECWQKPLQATFEPWIKQGRVVIIDKLMTSTDSPGGGGANHPRHRPQRPRYQRRAYQAGR